MKKGLIIYSVDTVGRPRERVPRDGWSLQPDRESKDGAFREQKPELGRKRGKKLPLSVATSSREKNGNFKPWVLSQCQSSKQC